MKKLVIRDLLTVVVAGLISLSFAGRATAQGMTYVFTAAADGGVDVVGTGMGMSDRVDPITSDDWDVQDFVTNFMVLDNGATLGAVMESGLFTNVTTGVSVNILSFSIDEDGGLGFDNDLDFGTDAPITFNLNDEMTFSLFAHFTPGTLVIGDLVAGTHIDLGHTTGAGIAEESFGITTVIVSVPEPSSMAVLICIVGSVLSRRRRLLR